MMMTRRGFLGGILAACAAPAIVKASSMMKVPVRKPFLPYGFPILPMEVGKLEGVRFIEQDWGRLVIYDANDVALVTMPVNGVDIADCSATLRIASADTRQSGMASFFRVIDSHGVERIEGTVSEYNMGGLTLANANLITGQQMMIDDFRISSGNESGPIRYSKELMNESMKVLFA